MKYKILRNLQIMREIGNRAAYNAKHGTGFEISTPKQMLQRLPVAQVKAGNSSEKSLNEIRQIIYFLYRLK